MKPSKKFRYPEYPASDLNKRTAEIIAEAQHGKLPVLITKHDKPVIALVPFSMVEKMERAGILLEALEEEGTRIETVTREIKATTRANAKDEDDEDVHPTRREKTVSMPISPKARR